MSGNQVEGKLRVFVVPVDVLESNLDIYEKMVYMVLRSHCSPYESTAFPSFARIAKLGSMSVRQAKEVVKRLEEKGVILHEKRYKGTNSGKVAKTSNLYTVNDIPKDLIEKEDLKAAASHGAQDALEVVHNVHKDSAQSARGVVHGVHEGSAQSAHKQNHLKKPTEQNHIKNKSDDRYSNFYNLFPELKGQNGSLKN